MRSTHSSCDDGRRIFERDVRVEDTLSVSKVVCDAGRGMCTGSVSLKVALALRFGFSQGTETRAVGSPEEKIGVCLLS